MSATTAYDCQIPTASPKPGIPSEIEFIGSEEFAELEYPPPERRQIQELLSATEESQMRGRADNPLGAVLQRSLPPLTLNQEQLLFRRMNFNRWRAESIRSTLASKRPSRAKLAEIRALLEEADQIRRRIVESNIRLVVSIARKYATSPQDMQEFVSDGLMILLGAVEKFDYSRGFRFSTYATHSVQRYLFRSMQQRQRYHQRFALKPGELMADVAESYESNEAAEQDDAEIYNMLMTSAEGRLNAREEDVLKRRFGTDGLGVTQTLREIAADLGISKERVRQIQIAALNKLHVVASELQLLPVAG